MYKDDLYAYWLTVNGTEQEQKKVFDMLTEEEIIGEHLQPDGPDSAPYSHYCYPENEGSGPEWNEDDMENALHEIAMQVPNAILEIEGENTDDESYGFKKRFHGDLYQEVKLETKMPPLLDGADVPFEQRNSREHIQEKITESKRKEKVEELVDKLCNETDFDLLYAQKTALFENRYAGVPIPKEALDGLLNFLDLVGDLGETLGRFQYDGIEPPFPLQPDYEKKIVVFPPEPEPKVHIFCEEMEGENGIREFSILGVSRHEDKLQQMLQAKIERDDYGFIAQNGIAENDHNNFRTEYADGFVEYYILEKEVLSPEQIQSLLNSKEYDTKFYYPDNLKQILTDAMSQIVADLGYTNADISKGVDSYLADKTFQAALKDTYWFYEDHISNETAAATFCTGIISYDLKEKPELLSELGVVPEFKAPDNLQDVMVGSIYDAARDLRLPSVDVSDILDECLHNGKFRTLVTEKFGGVSHLDDAGKSEAAKFCYDFLSDHLRPKQRPGLDQIIAGAASRATAPDKSTGKELGR